MTDGDREALDTAQSLTTAMRTLAAEVKRLRRYGRHNRWFILVDVVLTVLLAVSGALSVHAANQASHANSAQLALCKSGNVARAQQIELWEYVLRIGKQPTTKQGREIVARFDHHLHVVFAARNCAALGSKTP